MQDVIQTFVVSDSVVSASLDDEVVLLNVETGIYYGLDAVGARIWSLLEEGTDLETLEGRLLQEYVVEPEQLRADIAEFLDALQGMGLLWPAPQ